MAIFLTPDLPPGTGANATNGGNVRFYGQTDADNGRAVGLGGVAGVTLDSSRNTVVWTAHTKNGRGRPQ